MVNIPIKNWNEKAIMGKKNGSTIIMLINAVYPLTAKLEKKKMVLRQKVKLSTIVLQYDFTQYFCYSMFASKHNIYHVHI